LIFYYNRKAVVLFSEEVSCGLTNIESLQTPKIVSAIQNNKSIANALQD
jgi:hypothetical protein